MGAIAATLVWRSQSGRGGKGRRDRSGSARRGFTLVELLVVITIIGILMMMLLPTVHRSTESARRIQCANNLKQLALAVKQYELYQGVLPASGLHGPPAPGYYRFVEPRSGPQFSWLVLILPQLEQANLHSQFDFSRSVFQQPKDPQAIQVPTLLCPSDSARGQYFVDGALTGGKRLAKGNYAAFCSPFHTEVQLSFPGALIATGQSTAAIRDGLSNTLMLSEVRVRSHPQDQRGAWALAWTAASLLAFDMHHNIFMPRDRYVASNYFVGLAQPPNNQGPNVDMLYACPDMAGAQLEEMPCGVWQKGTEWEFLSAAPRSRHPGGVNVAFADGHVGFLINEVDDFVMAYLISINDGQSLDHTPYVY